MVHLTEELIFISCIDLWVTFDLVVLPDGRFQFFSQSEVLIFDSEEIVFLTLHVVHRFTRLETDVLAVLVLGRLQL